MISSQREKKDTRTRIFLASAELFSVYGYNGVSIRQICEKVGVGKPTLYYYFKDKESLIEQLYKYAFDNLKKLTSDYVQENVSFFERLRGLITLRQAFARQFPNFFRFFLGTNISSLPDSTKKVMNDHFNWVFERMSAFIDEGKQEGVVDPEVPSHLVVHSLLGVLNQITYRHIYLENKEMISDQDADEVYHFWKNYIFNYNAERRDI